MKLFTSLAVVLVLLLIHESTAYPRPCIAELVKELFGFDHVHGNAPPPNSMPMIVMPQYPPPQYPQYPPPQYPQYPPPQYPPPQYPPPEYQPFPNGLPYAS